MGTEPRTAGNGRVSAGRLKAVRIIAVIMAVAAVAFGLLTAVFAIVDEGQEIHAFHNVLVASLLLVLSAPPAIAVARAPERAMGPLMALTALGIAGLATMALSLTVDLFTLPFIVLVGVLWAVRPTRDRAIPPGRPSPHLGVLVLAAAVPLVVYSLRHAELQRIDTVSEHAEFFHWVEAAFYAMAILLLAALASLRPVAYRLAAWCAGVALAVVGAASLRLQPYVSALDTPWAWAALAGGVVFIAVTEWEVRRASGRVGE